jgi:hypothetical protein
MKHKKRKSEIWGAKTKFLRIITGEIRREKIKKEGDEEKR